MLMSDADKAITALKRSMDELTTALRDLDWSGRTDDPGIAQLTAKVEGLSLILMALRTKMDSLTDKQFRSLLDRPSVSEEGRNTPNPQGDS
jgi:hypothetical protein